ncbi:hypothetical protein DFH06DRAFT_1133881 [Mycena polygramma]|nr:hypothetical protein DFH06DRAFT_1133881 [Mycena polygramma]
MKMDASPSKSPLPLWNFDASHPLDDPPQAAEKTRIEFPDILDRDLTTRIVHRPIEHARRRIRQACVKCRSRKAKCSGEQPSCTRCLARGVDCEYDKDGRARGPKPRAAPSASASEINWRLSPYSVNLNEHDATPRDTALLLPRLFLPSPFVDAPTRTLDATPSSRSAGFSFQYIYSDGYTDSDSPFVVLPPFLPPGLHGYGHSHDENGAHTRRRDDGEPGYGMQLDGHSGARSPRDFDSIPIDPRLVGTPGCEELEHAIGERVGLGPSSPGTESEGSASASASSGSADGESEWIPQRRVSLPFRDDRDRCSVPPPPRATPFCLTAVLAPDEHFRVAAGRGSAQPTFAGGALALQSALGEVSRAGVRLGAVVSLVWRRQFEKERTDILNCNAKETRFKSHAARRVAQICMPGTASSRVSGRGSRACCITNAIWVEYCTNHGDVGIRTLSTTASRDEEKYTVQRLGMKKEGICQADAESLPRQKAQIFCPITWRFTTSAFFLHF